MNKYQFNLVWSNRDNEYMVTCPEFPGLSAFGATPQEALEEAEIALELFIETYEEDNIPLPEPQTVPEYSGQLRLRLPKSLHAQAAKLAESDEISLNQYICNALQAKVTGHQIAERFVREMTRQLHIHSMRNLVFFKKATFTDRVARLEYETYQPKDKVEYSN